MTCIVLVKNPNGGGVLAITEGENEDIAQWDCPTAAEEGVREHTLVKAWGGWVVDLDNEEVISV